MPIWNNFPYSDTHELNLDYILETQKKQEEEFNTVIDEANQIKNDTEELKNETSQLKQETSDLKNETEQLNQDTSDLKNEAEATVQPFLNKYAQIDQNTEDIQTNATNISLNSERINNIASLTEGSTSGDAELADIRIEYNGITKSSAGDSVRDQIDYLIFEEKRNKKVNNKQILSPTENHSGNYYLINTGVIESASDWNCNKYSVEELTYYKVKGNYGYTAAGIIWLNSNNEIIRQDLYTVVVQSNQSYEITVKSPANATALLLNAYNGWPYAEKLTDNDIVYSDTEYKKVDLTFIEDKYIPATSITPSDFEGMRYALVDVNPGEVYLIQTETYYDVKGYFIFTYNNEMLAKSRTDNGYVNDIVVIPDGAKKLYINGVMPSYNAKLGYTALYKLNNKESKKIDIPHTWLTVGDSITDSATLTAQNIVMPNYVDFVSEELGLNVINAGTSGTGFLNNDGTAMRYADKINSITSDFDIVSIFGSFNDLFYSDYELGTATDTSDMMTVYGQIKKCIENIYSKNIEAKILLITPTPWINITPGVSSSSPNYDTEGLAYCEAIKTIGKMYSIPVLDMFTESNLHPWDNDFRTGRYTNNDGTHPLSSVHLTYITPKVVEALKRII